MKQVLQLDIQYIVYVGVFGVLVTIILSLRTVLTGLAVTTRIPGGGSTRRVLNLPGLNGRSKQQRNKQPRGGKKQQHVNHIQRRQGSQIHAARRRNGGQTSQRKLKVSIDNMSIPAMIAAA